MSAVAHIVAVGLGGLNTRVAFGSWLGLTAGPRTRFTRYDMGRKPLLPNEPSVLSGFDAVDELGASFEAGVHKRLDINSSDLALGPLAEVLILRREWRLTGFDVRLKGDGDARHAVVSEVSKKTKVEGSVGPEVGAIQLVGDSEQVSLAAHEFVAAAGRLAQEAGMPVDASRILKGVFGELIDNVSQHAGTGAKGLAIYELRANSIALVVADSGQGVVQGYVSSQPELAGLGAMDALEWAVQRHKSRFREPGRGTGFSTVLRAMRAMDAALRVRSDDASIEIEGPSDSATWYVKDQPVLRGFVVTLSLSWRQ